MLCVFTCTNVYSLQYDGLRDKNLYFLCEKLSFSKVCHVAFVVNSNRQVTALYLLSFYSCSHYFDDHYIPQDFDSYRTIFLNHDHDDRDY